MARPTGTGIKFFSHDCQHDVKLEYIEAIHGLTGYAIYFKILEWAYGVNGYFIEWNSKTAALFSKRINVPPQELSLIVKDMINEGLFNESIFSGMGILTSRGMQKRFLQATRKRVDDYIEEPINLINCSISDTKNEESFATGSKPEFLPEETRKEPGSNPEKVHKEINKEISVEENLNSQSGEKVDLAKPLKAENKSEIPQSAPPGEILSDLPIPDEEKKKLTKRLRGKNLKHAPGLVEIIDYFKERSGKQKIGYATVGPLKLIIHWLNEGHETEDFKKVIDYKIKQFAGTDNERYIALDTFFRFEKFESNLEKANNQFSKPLKPENKAPPRIPQFIPTQRKKPNIAKIKEIAGR